MDKTHINSNEIDTIFVLVEICIIIFVVLFAILNITLRRGNEGFWSKLLTSILFSSPTTIDPINVDSCNRNNKSAQST